MRNNNGEDFLGLKLVADEVEVALEGSSTRGRQVVGRAAAAGGGGRGRGRRRMKSEREILDLWNGECKGLGKDVFVLTSDIISDNTQTYIHCSGGHIIVGKRCYGITQYSPDRLGFDGTTSSLYTYFLVYCLDAA